MIILWHESEDVTSRILLGPYISYPKQNSSLYKNNIQICNSWLYLVMVSAGYIISFTFSLTHPCFSLMPKLFSFCPRFMFCLISDPCVPSPCFNDGTCVKRNGRAVCLCILGYHGDFCESGIS